jgi:large subunit ribosomal protein L21
LATVAAGVVDSKAVRPASRSIFSEWTPCGTGFIERVDMYAVIKTGGKQYKVAAGEKIKVEQIAADVGQVITLDQVLAVGAGADLRVGSPLVAGASVVATVVAQGKHDKVRIFKMRRRKHYQKRQGHRQTYTELQISAVNG